MSEAPSGIEQNNDTVTTMPNGELLANLPSSSLDYGEPAETILLTKRHEDNRKETGRKTIQRCIIDSQMNLGEILNIDILDVRARVGNWGMSSTYEDPDGYIRATLYTPQNVNIEDETAMTVDQEYRLTHELGHAVTEKELKTHITNPELFTILNEGIAELTAISTTNNNINMPEVLGQLKMQVNKSSNTIYDAFAMKEGAPKLDKVIASDGYTRDGRSLAHITGLYFVFSVLSPEKVYAWPVLLKNQPTTEELLNPDLYKERVGELIDDFQKPLIVPRLPSINPD